MLNLFAFSFSEILFFLCYFLPTQTELFCQQNMLIWKTMLVFTIKGFLPTGHKPWSQILKRMQIDDSMKSHRPDIFMSKIFTVAGKYHWKMNLRMCSAEKVSEISNRLSHAQSLNHPRCLRKPLKRDWAHGEQSFFNSFEKISLMSCFD